MSECSCASSYGSGSKANVARGFWKEEGNCTVGKLMSDLLDYAVETGSVRADDADLGGGYVLTFSNRTFAEFVTDSVGRNIYDARYALQHALELTFFKIRQVRH